MVGKNRKALASHLKDRPVSEPTAQVAETPPADEPADATFDKSSGQDDATFENPDKSG